MMKSRHILRLTLLGTAAGLAAAAAEVKQVTITANDQMRFDVRRIDAAPGQRIHVELRNEGTMPREVMAHNWILLDAGVDVAAYASAAAAAKAQAYRPTSLNAEVLAAIPLIGAHESGQVEFAAPAKPGRYPYLCSFPGHSQIGMRGELVVAPPAR